MRLLARFWYSVAWALILWNQVEWFSCTHHNRMVGVKNLQNSFWRLSDLQSFHIVKRWMNHEVCIVEVYISTNSLLLSWGHCWDRFAIYSFY